MYIFNIYFINNLSFFIVDKLVAYINLFYMLYFLYYYYKEKLYFIIYSIFNNGDWGLGIGDWGLGIGDWAQSPIPNPQSPIPHPPGLFFIFFKY